MIWIDDLQTRSKLLLGFAVVIALLIATVLVGRSAVIELRDAQRALFEDDLVDATTAIELRGDLHAQRADLLALIVAPAPAAIAATEAMLGARATEIDAARRQLGAVRSDDGRRPLLDELDATIAAYRQVRQQQFDLLRSGDVDAARTLSEREQAARHQRIVALAQQLEDGARRRAAAGMEASERRAERAGQLFAALGIGAVALAVLVALVLTRSIAAPLRRLTDTAERITAGELRVDDALPARRDEVGALATAFERMTGALRRMADTAERIAAGDLDGNVVPQSDRDVLGNAFARMASDLRRQVGELVEAANVLGAATAEIVASTAQLAAGASQSAAAVSETSATVEEVRQTVEMSSQKARVVADAAQRAARTAQEGRRATDGVVDGMRHIREQMDAIAASMAHLSEQSLAIGQIIATVEDLAVQSKLLAVNASIEAAKAGEHGKGFAVVAAEVKSLAEQSRQATDQVRTLLSDIQKATGAAVMATEQGGKAVDAGGQQSAAAGSAIIALADGVDEAAQAALQISASAQQQRVGVDQVAQAMESIRQASEQNAASATQLDAAARDLDALGQRLKRMVERYRV